MSTLATTLELAIEAIKPGPISWKAGPRKGSRKLHAIEFGRYEYRLKIWVLISDAELHLWFCGSSKTIDMYVKSCKRLESLFLFELN